MKGRIQREENEAKMKAQLEEEHVALQKTGGKIKKDQHLEAMKGLNATQARMPMYDQVKAIEEERKGSFTYQAPSQNSTSSRTWNDDE